MGGIADMRHTGPEGPLLTQDGHGNSTIHDQFSARAPADYLLRT
jgi:hypothetical protein